MSATGRAFDSLYSHGFVRVAVGTPRVHLANPSENIGRVIALANRAIADGAILVVFPELGLSGYSNEDLIQQDALLDGVEPAVLELVDASRTLPAILVAGAPIRAEGRLFNCAIVVCRGRLIGVVPKTYLPNYREFYEKRQFASGAQAIRKTIELAGALVPFGNDLLFETPSNRDFVVHVEVCEDVWVPLPPSTYAALAGATVLANLSASNVTVGKADYRRLLCTSQSAKCLAAYVYAAAGYGESTTDLAWDGHGLICENGEALAESVRFGREEGLILADVDLDRLRQERMRMTSFADCGQLHGDRLSQLRRIAVDLPMPSNSVPLRREIARFPYVPSDARSLDERCAEVYEIQVQGLTRRMEAAAIDKLVIGVSGGLDSAQALLVAVGAVDALHLPRTNVLAVTMPGFATTGRTRDNAWRLMEALGTTAREIDIRPSSEQMLADIDHPHARGQVQHDVTFENVQAGERASHLFRLANLHGALVVGTSDLSELALGYATYGVGDHMSHYAVNGSVPKTLIRHLIRWKAQSGHLEDRVASTLQDVLATTISAELVPSTDTGVVPPTAEETVGPYELQDFNLYYLSRFGFRPSKVAFLAHQAWSRNDRGRWPAWIEDAERRDYDLPTIKHWLEVFIVRFFERSQFKRSAMPNGPKVGSGGSLSPRSDWRAPSDARADAWLNELRTNVP